MAGRRGVEVLVEERRSFQEDVAGEFCLCCYLLCRERRCWVERWSGGCEELCGLNGLYSPLVGHEMNIGFEVSVEVVRREGLGGCTRDAWGQLVVLRVDGRR